MEWSIKNINMRFCLNVTRDMILYKFVDTATIYFVKTAFSSKDYNPENGSFVLVITSPFILITLQLTLKE